MAESATKEMIIEKANQLFQEKGYNQVTIQDICDACEITKTTFYYHMKSKDDLIINNYDIITENLTQLMVSLIAADNYWEQLWMCFEVLIRESVRYGQDLYSQLFIVNLKEDRGSFDMREDLTRIAISVIRKGQEAGQIRNPNPAEQLYEASAYLFTGYEITWCIKKGNFDWMENTRRSLEVMYDILPELRYDHNK
ncbi:TetR/AcrR family transcriptional regulator [Diplocloster agilis]|uniref:TetR/AcrR family transcriptional regulator n=1 Tax=Diplocloster agilis TaxID=2850323 RepID=A0A949NHZ8_9FIRM|nr:MULTISPECIES: TetR/AcrR family transcriptional regulator [Lachnospiraceae]MBU9739113.1 TetR/AcrR family transcriptional regulator [Diplocloster agilis]MBU9745701.1 TetR/AcrR family transcriptional regulator [Diplocloster agilis]MCU6735096.1 TetR/AcrR family transcriptional regulator [Suonthocola fibrivorans]SCJ63879.1 DNA-binding transcriptional regulator EnvR [uncultured Clostridium sp.]